MNNSVIEKIKGLEAYLEEFKEMHKEEKQINNESVNAFIIVIDSYLKNIAEDIEKC